MNFANIQLQWESNTYGHIQIPFNVDIGKELKWDLSRPLDKHPTWYELFQTPAYNRKIEVEQGNGLRIGWQPLLSR
jgi:hypothetical protein